MQRLFASAFAFSTAILACSGTSDPGTVASDGGTRAEGEGVGSGPSDGAFGVSTPESKDPSCATATYVASKAPLALNIMLDRSNSMLATAGSGIAKWAAAKNALASFMGKLPASDVSVGLSYFPQRHAGVPASCTTDAQCGTHGPCGVRICLQTGDPVACTTSAECGGNRCVAVGRCTGVDKLCLPTAADPCGPGGGTCRLWCEDGLSCKVVDYSTPAVAIAPSAQTKGAIASSLSTTEPWGDTPTAPALGGALSSAEDFAAENAGFVPAVVFVTDGMPTNCGITDAEGIAELSAFGKSRGVRTFVIGIFAPADEAQARAHLDVIAKAGGSGKAIVVKTSSNVATELAAALEDIRKRAVPCEYAMPVPANGGIVDTTKVNVIVTPQGQKASTVPWVDAASTCGDGAGWHYEGSKIVLCSRTCEAVAKAADVKVDIVTGCQTVVR
ncbi:MAG TPA: VWA domain-containing protein [Labilithrix sp.]|nr:VWA domain-containing protein [Labilithrix sp.]